MIMKNRFEIQHGLNADNSNRKLRKEYFSSPSARRVLFYKKFLCALLSSVRNFSFCFACTPELNATLDAQGFSSGAEQSKAEE